MGLLHESRDHAYNIGDVKSCMSQRNETPNKWVVQSTINKWRRTLSLKFDSRKEVSQSRLTVSHMKPGLCDGDPKRRLEDLNPEKLMQQAQVIHQKSILKGHFDSLNGG